MIDKKLVIGCKDSELTYNLNGSNIKQILKNKEGMMLVTTDGARVQLPVNRYIINEDEFKGNGNA